MTFVVGTDTKLYYRTEITDENFIGKSWAKVDETAKVTQVSCGRDGLFVALINGNPMGRLGVDTDVPQGTSWEHLKHLDYPKMTSITIGEDGDVWAAWENTKFEVARATGVDDKSELYGNGKEVITGMDFEVLNVGRGQVWGVNKFNEIYRRKFTTSNPSGTEWEQMPGKMA